MSGRDFWSRRRAGVAKEAETEARLADEVAQAEIAKSQEDKTDEELLAEFDLPNPDAMQQGDDFTVFLKDGVPARLKTRALRKLWRLNPVLANVDGLVDYGEDFTDAATVVENLQTAYQVGKGMLKHVEELARQAEEAANEDEAPAPQEDPEELLAETAPEPAPAQDPEPIPTYTAPAPLEEEEAPDPLPANFRRMRFSFDDSTTAT